MAIIDDMGALAAMTAEVQAWCDDKGWSNDGRTFGDSMALLHSEVSEAVEAFRVHGLEDATKGEAIYFDNGHVIPKPEGVGSEFADVLIRLLDDCGRYGIDLFVEYRRKMDYNYTRAYRHGNKAL